MTKPLVSATVTTGGLGTLILSILHIVNPILGFASGVLICIHWYMTVRKDFKDRNEPKGNSETQKKT